MFLKINIARIANPVQCHSKLSGNKNFMNGQSRSLPSLRIFKALRVYLLISNRILGCGKVDDIHQG